MVAVLVNMRTSPTWKLADIQAQLNKSGEQQGYTLGAQALSLHRFTLPNQTQALQVFADSEGNISLLRLEDAILTQNANDLERLWGPPKAKNILESNSKFAPSMQWIFPDRGITLYVMNPESKGTMSLSAISLYVPTSLEHYRDDLGGNERVYMFED